MANRRASRLISRFTITPREQRDLEARFRRDMRALRQQLAQRWDHRETRERFFERLFEQFEAILERYDRLFTMRRVPVRRGRPTRLERPPPKKRGAPVKFTPEDEQWLVTEIDRIQRRATARGRPFTDASALGFHMRLLLRNAFIEAGHAPDEARRLAKEEALERERSPVFRKKMTRLKERLSRARGSGARKTRH